MSRASLRLLSVAVIAALVTGLAALLPRDNAVEGWFTDHVVAARVALFGAQPLASPHVVVIGMDRRSLQDPGLRTRPRILFSPVYAEMIDKVLAHGAKGVVLDLILAYDPAGLPVGDAFPLKRYDTAFLRLLRREQLGRPRGAGPVGQAAADAKDRPDGRGSRAGSGRGSDRCG